MHCRTCGKDVSEKAVACPSCGMAPLGGDAFCQDCGAATKPKQVMCTSCGVKLRGQGLMNTGTVKAVTGMTTGMAILWILCCFPIGYVKLNQGLKGLAWVLISVLTGGLGVIAMIVDFFMCNAKANNVGHLGEWEFFPRD